jgi:hypothetical protein
MQMGGLLNFNHSVEPLGVNLGALECDMCGATSVRFVPIADISPFTEAPQSFRYCPMRRRLKSTKNGV